MPHALHVVTSACPLHATRSACPHLPLFYTSSPALHVLTSRCYSCILLASLASSPCILSIAFVQQDSVRLSHAVSTVSKAESAKAASLNKPYPLSKAESTKAASAQARPCPFEPCRVFCQQGQVLLARPSRHRRQNHEAGCECTTCRTS